MGKQSEHGISWCDFTFNPWEGCVKVSPACAYCYAETRDKRIHQGKHWGANSARKEMAGSYWTQPLKWNREAAAIGERPRVFSLSLGDWLEDHPELVAPRARLIQTAARTKHLDWLFLTKRPEGWRDRMVEVAEFWERQGDYGSQLDARELRAWVNAEIVPDNFWIGTTVENQQMADARIPELLTIPAKVRFLSVEPMLSPLTLALRRCGKCGERSREGLRCEHCGQHSIALPGGIHWVIAGGESGPRARASHPHWFRSLRDQCQAANIPFHFKQHGEWIAVDQLDAFMNPGETYSDKGWPDPKEYIFPDGTITVRLGKQHTGRILDGRTWDELPEVE